MAPDMAKKGSARRTSPSHSNLRVIFVIYTHWHSYCSSFFAAHETFFAWPGFHTQACSVSATGGLEEHFSTQTATGGSAPAHEHKDLDRRTLGDQPQTIDRQVYIDAPSLLFSRVVTAVEPTRRFCAGSTR